MPPAMSSSCSNDETQILDLTDSPHNPSPINPALDPHQATEPVADTPPLETQPTDDDPDPWGKTQVVDDYEEDGFENSEDDRGTERTEVLTDDEGLSDDATTGCVEDEKKCWVEIGETEALVDPDASTDEEGNGGGDHVSASPFSGGSDQSKAHNSGSVKKSFAAVRAASLRSSGLSAARSITPKEDLAEGIVNGSIAIGMEKCPNGTPNLASHGTKACEVGLNHMIENHKDDTKRRGNNPRVKKLFSDETPSDNIEEDSPSSLVPDYALGGLSYVGSQEPGDLSQANALDIVDEFLLVNNMESPPELKSSKKDMVKLSSVLGSKGTQPLGRKADRRSPVGKDETFEWIDSREDERGGEFFSKRKDTFFESRCRARKSHSQPPKARLFSSDVTRGPLGNSGEKGGANPQVLTHSDSRLVLGSASGGESMHKSEAKTKKNLFKHMDERLSSEQQVETNASGGGEEDKYDVGPDTQMAAEAMETLFHECDVNYIVNKDTENFSKGATKKRNSSKNATLGRTSTPYSEAITTRSKRRKVISPKSRRETPNIPRKLTRNSRARKSADGTTVETNTLAENWKVEGHLNASSSVSGNGSSKSLTRENIQLSIAEELIPGDFHVNTTPVAHRTRHSRAVSSLRKAEASSEPVKAKRKGPNMVSDQIAQVEKETPNHTNGHENGKLHGEEPKAGSHITGFISHPKRRRTMRNIPSDSNINGNMNNSSVSIYGVPTASVLLSTGQGKTRKYIKSVTEVVTAIKQKKRSVSTRKASKNISNVVINQNVDIERNAKLDGSPKGKIQLSESTYTTPSKTIGEASPVCMARDSLRTPCSKGLSRSGILRELTRLAPTEASPTFSKDSRRRKDMASVRVLFSHHLDDDTIKQQKKILARLGVQVASCMSDATHFITDKFVRTRNMLEAMALGKPVVTHLWLESCGQASCFIDEKNYILRDVKKEKEIGFSMPVSLARACQCPLLQGRRVFITPNVKPGRELIASLVKVADGQPLERIGRSATKDDKVPDDLLVISSEEDYEVCKPLLEKGTEVFSAELILNGIVIQKLECKRHQLFLDHVKRTRSTIWLRQADGKQFNPVTRCT